MRENLKRQHYLGKDGRIHFDGDWFGKGLPSNVSLGDDFFISSSMGFERISSVRNPCLVIGNEVGMYDQFGIEIGENGVVEIDDYSIINGSRIVCNQQVSIGKYCMISWSTYITDTLMAYSRDRIELLKSYLRNPEGVLETKTTAPVKLDDNVWVGFGCVILPGVSIGEGAVVASKTVVNEDVAPYTVVGGNPVRIIKHLPHANNR